MVKKSYKLPRDKETWKCTAISINKTKKWLTVSTLLVNQGSMLQFLSMPLITCMLWWVLFRRVHVRGLIRKRNRLLKWDWFICNEHQLHAYQYHALVNKSLHAKACWMTPNNQVMHLRVTCNECDWFPTTRHEASHLPHISMCKTWIFANKTRKT